jgi:4-hydroxybenzoate polyprenyltransferase
VGRQARSTVTSSFDQWNTAVVTRIAIEGERQDSPAGRAVAAGSRPASPGRAGAPSLKILGALLRVHQWVKNAFVAAPLFFTPGHLSWQAVLYVIAGISCFCAVSSAIYVLNDFIDREADRLHPEKRHRPLAAGTLRAETAAATGLLLAVTGLLGGLVLSPPFAAVLALYLLTNVAYCLWLKNVSIVDIIFIAIGFVLRVQAGALLIAVKPSVWILVCTGLLALFLAIAKRRDDIVKVLDASHRRSINGYNKPFLDSALTIVLGALVVSYTIYTTDEAVMQRLGSDHLYLTVPFVLAGILRYLQITLVEHRSGSPTRIALTDRFLSLTVLGWIGLFGVLMYL